MSKTFYQKLAISSIKRNAQMYIPYLIVGSFTVALFYIMNTLSRNEEIGHDTLLEILSFGRYVIGFFSVIILFYINGFLMRCRQKELGLYHIFGMSKKNIGRLLFWEIIIVTLTTLLLGVAVGILLSKLMYLVLIRLTGADLTFVIPFSGVALISTIFLFLISFYIILKYNVVKVHFANPIDLLKGGQMGEREPESKWAIMLIGVVLLIGAYAIALTNPNKHFIWSAFFVAVLMVMLGTYYVFMAGITIILKALRNNKKIYYHPRYFTVISGLLYRMKQHATGLATICILSTMVLTTLSLTASLYIGNEEINQNQFPYEFQVSIHDPTDDQRRYIFEIINQLLEPYQVQLDDMNEINESSALRLRFDTGLSQREALEFSLQLGERLGQIEDILVWHHSRPEAQQRAVSSSGGLLFVGSFLGSLFLLTTGLILYYKQISEGFEDRERFVMMQKVGMSKEEVKKTIQTQVRFMFFLPLIMAIVHVFFAFNLIINLLAILDLTNVRLFAICTAVIIGIFTLVYGFLYRITAQVYYKMVCETT